MVHSIKGKSRVLATKATPVFVDLSIANKDLTTIEDVEAFLQTLIDKDLVPYGGYGEKRYFYQSSPAFNNQSTFRDVHLGIDLWAAVETPVIAPLDGTILSLQNNDKMLDYGGTIIVKHHMDGLTFYTLYGHLATRSLLLFEAGAAVKAGDTIGYLGSKSENGGWFPHLHFQLIFDLEGIVGDYPGVASAKEAQFKLLNCPNPILLTGFF